jgi:hypothetical protein
MNLLRGLLFDNLGLKLAALLLALLVYLNVYLDRPAEMTISFPVQIQDLGDSLSLSGPVPSTVQAQLRGTGKQLLRMRVTEPPIKISLDGVGPGRFEREVSAEDLPLAGYEGVEASRGAGCPRPCGSRGRPATTARGLPWSWWTPRACWSPVRARPWRSWTAWYSSPCGSAAGATHCARRSRPSPCRTGA